MQSWIYERIRSHFFVLLAIFIVLGGTAYAALPKILVSTKQLKNGAVTSAKIKNGAVTAAKIKNGAVTAAKIKDGAVTGAKLLISSVPQVPSAKNADQLGGLAAFAYQLRVTGLCSAGQSTTAIAQDGSVSCTANGGPPSGPAGGALSGSYPNPTLNVSGGPCPSGQF